MFNKNLYESIIKDISQIIKSHLNEGIKDFDKYNFVIKILTPLCEKYFKFAGIYGKVNTSLTKAIAGKDLHRGSFNVQVQSLNNPKDKGERFKVLCKIYNEQKTDDTVTIDFESIYNGYYKYFATIIDNTVYYLNYSDVINYYQSLGNKCVSKDRRFIFISADYFIDKAQYSATLTSDDIKIYSDGYKRYINKG
jgi:hypothetical protein